MAGPASKGKPKTFSCDFYAAFVEMEHYSISFEKFCKTKAAEKVPSFASRFSLEIDSVTMAERHIITDVKSQIHTIPILVAT